MCTGRQLSEVTTSPETAMFAAPAAALADRTPSLDWAKECTQCFVHCSVCASFVKGTHIVST